MLFYKWIFKCQKHQSLKFSDANTNALVTQSFYRPWASVPPVIFAENLQVVTAGPQPISKIYKNVHKFPRRWAGGRPAVGRLSAWPPPAHLCPSPIYQAKKQYDHNTSIITNRMFSCLILRSIMFCSFRFIYKYFLQALLFCGFNNGFQHLLFADTCCLKAGSLDVYSHKILLNGLTQQHLLNIHPATEWTLHNR